MIHFTHVYNIKEWTNEGYFTARSQTRSSFREKGLDCSFERFEIIINLSFKAKFTQRVIIIIRAITIIKLELAQAFNIYVVITRSFDMTATHCST